MNLTDNAEKSHIKAVFGRSPFLKFKSKQNDSITVRNQDGGYAW